MASGLIGLMLPFGCAEQTEPTDPLHEMLVAQCEQRVRCNCARTEQDDDCEAFARGRAAELRSRSRTAGATMLDEECAARLRDVANGVCVGAGIPYTVQALSDAARASACGHYLFHGPRQSGEPCDHPVSLPLGGLSDCTAGSFCFDWGEGAECETPEVMGVGSVCRDIDAYSGCPLDLICVDVDANTGRCLPLTKVGDPCVGFRGDQCGGPPGQWCDLDTSTCRASPGVGEACESTSSSACAVDARCVEGVCEPRPLPGEPCMAYGDCAPGFRCTDGVCEGYEACWF